MLIIQHTTPQENSLLSTDIIVEGNDTNTKHQLECSIFLSGVGQYNDAKAIQFLFRFLILCDVGLKAPYIIFEMLVSLVW